LKSPSEAKAGGAKGKSMDDAVKTIAADSTKLRRDVVPCEEADSCVTLALFLVMNENAMTFDTIKTEIKKSILILV
jgi:hypothetical protein